MIAAESSRAHQVLTDAENELKSLEDNKHSAEDQLLKLFDPQHFGAKGEWKKLDGTCLSTDSGEYVILHDYI
jgi:protein kinase C substrate 80K-H